MTQILNFLYVTCAVILLFGAAIFVHEFGHFWVARKRGLKVEAFAIGLGPKIITWRRGGIEYSWRWIPAGGFVKLPQMVTSEALEGGTGPDAEKLPPASPFSKILVALAGPSMNVVFAFAIATLIYFVGLPVLVNPSVIGYVEPDSEEAKLGIRAGDRIVAVNDKPVKSWQEILMITALARTNLVPVKIQRDGVVAVYQLAAKVTDEEIGLKLLNLGPREHPVVGSVEAGSPAERVGMRPMDKFISFAGVPIVSEEQLKDIINKRGGKPSEVKVERGGEQKSFTVTPRFDPATKRARIGIGFALGYYQIQRPGPAPWTQMADVWSQTINTLAALFHSRETGVRAKDLSGPVGILTMLAVQVNTDYRLALKFLVLLNVNLAIINLLPLPVLDGGHILLAIIERIRRRPLSVRFVEYTTTGFAVLLISFMLYVTFFDLKRIGRFKSLFQRDTRIEQPEKPPTLSPMAPAPAK